MELLFVAILLLNGLTDFVVVCGHVQTTTGHPRTEAPEGDMDAIDDAIDSYCQDLSLDCEEREHLCSNGAFHEIMLDRCPKTCNMCHELEEKEDSKRPVESTEQVPRSRAISVEDYEVVPSISDIIESVTTEAPVSVENSMLSLNQLVGSAERYIPDLESIDAVYANALKTRQQCRDFVSDCHTKLGLCDNIFYSRIMNRFCQRTCGFCGSAGHAIAAKRKQAFRKRTLKKPTKPLSQKTKGRPKVRGQVSVDTCLDRGIDCNEKRALCSHASYTTLMETMCRKTCSLCDSTD